MVPAVRPLRSLSMARGCAQIDSRPDTAKIGSADRVEVHHARLLAVIGVRKTFPHGLEPGTDIRTRLAFMRDARGGSGSSRGQDRGPQITLPCRMCLTSSGEQPSHSP